MATTLSTRLSETPVDSALVIVDRAHLNGMVSLLTELGWFEPNVRELDPPLTILGEFG